MADRDKLIGSRREFLNEDLDVSMTSMVGYRIELYSYNDDCEKKGLYDCMHRAPGRTRFNSRKTIPSPTSIQVKRK